MMTKSVWIVGAIATVVAGTLYYYTASFAVPNIATESMTHITDRYSIGVSYPHIGAGKNESALNQEFKSIIEDKILQFKTTHKERGENNENQKSALYIDYDVLSLTPRFIRVKFIISSYIAGDSSPEYYTSIVGYDVKTRATVFK